MLDVTPIKTFVKDLGDGDFKTLHFEALSNGEFDVGIYDVVLWPEGLSCNDKPVYAKRFKDYLSANNHLKQLSDGYLEVDHDGAVCPVEIANIFNEKQIEDEWKNSQQEREDEERGRETAARFDDIEKEFDLYDQEERDSW